MSAVCQFLTDDCFHVRQIWPYSQCFIHSLLTVCKFIDSYMQDNGMDRQSLDHRTATTSVDHQISWRPTDQRTRQAGQSRLEHNLEGSRRSAGMQVLVAGTSRLPARDMPSVVASTWYIR